jgi:hypothetical protein
MSPTVLCFVRWICVAWAALALFGCGGDDGGSRLLVDVRTDWVPGVEMVRVRNTVEDAPVAPVEVDARFGMDFIAGVRVAEIDLGDRTGAHALVTELIGPDGRVIAMRRTSVEIDGTAAVVVVFGRNGVPCSTATECAVPAPCAEGMCVEGTCLAAPRVGACGVGTYCSIDEGGCRPLPSGSDGGSGDSGAADSGGSDAGLDAGPACAADSECADGELCSDGACAASTAFRVTRVWLRDPHMFAEVGPPLCVCADGTSYIEEAMNSNIEDLDGNIVFVFAPLDPAAGTNTLHAHSDATCPSAGECRAGGDPGVVGSATHTTSGSAACYTPDRSTLTSAYAAPNAPTPPCFASAPISMALDVGGAVLALTDARVAARLSGSDDLVDGVLSGFLSSSAARDAELGRHSQICGGTLRAYDVLKGGNACESGDDSDGGGWYLYMDFEATRVDWVR